MKYAISQLRESDTKAIDVTKYFPTATEAVTIRVKRLTNEKRTEVIALSMKGQKIGDGGMEVKQTNWLQQSHIVELIAGVDTQATDFPFERWDEQTIKEIDDRCPQLIETLHDAIGDINVPLAPKSGEKSET
mgnify:CR=1 FL=1